MNRATPNLREFAKRLVTFETKPNSSSKKTGLGSFLVCDKLGSHLATFMGAPGLRALLLRALALASLETPWLSAVTINPDGFLEKPAELATASISKEMAEASVVLVVQLLGLLVAFIGERLTLQMVIEVWPELPASVRDFEMGETK